MSSPRFDAYSDRGSELAGADAAEALIDFLRTRRRGIRLEARRVARELGVDIEDIEDLLQLAIHPDIRVLEDASQIRCPHCSGRVDHSELLGALLSEGKAICPDCELEIEGVDELEPEQRYGLTEEADVEAREWQALQARRPRMRVVILTALVDELRQVQRQLEQYGEIGSEALAGGTIYVTGQVSGDHVDWDVYAAFTEATNPAAATATATAIMNLKPQIMMFVGVAGGVREKGAALGDVVAATVVHDYDIGKDTKEGFISREVQHKSTFALKQQAGHVALDETWRERIIPTESDPTEKAPEAHVEPIAAGGVVVAHAESQTYKLIRSVADRAVAVEMEGSGFLAAVDTFSGVDGIVIRGVSDLVSDKGQRDGEGWQDQAAANAAAFAIEMLVRLQPPSS